MIALNRRSVLGVCSAGAGSLVLGVRTAGAEAVVGRKFLARLIGLDRRGQVTVYSNVTELGQGTSTALAQLVAEELEAPWDAIQVQSAPLAPQFLTADEMATGGSGGVMGGFNPYRRAAAAAREMLLSAAARRLDAPADQLTIEAGHVRDRRSGRTLSYGALAGAASREPVPANPPLKPRSAWRIIGAATPRQDIPSKVNGKAIYAVDLDLPGMLTATIRQCPVFGGRLLGVDSTPALRTPGVLKVVALSDALAVVATGYWPARTGMMALKPVWDLGPNAGVESVALRERLLAAVDGDRGRLFDGWASSRTPPDDPARPARFQTALDASEGDHQAIYECPLLAHATMEPMSCVAQVTADGARLWMGAQTQSRVQEAVAAELGLARERVEVITVLAGGGFGRRSELDVPLQAARIAREVAGRPIKLIWSREEDIQHGYYRPASAVRLHAGLGPDGLPRALSFHSACPSVWKHSVWGAKEAKGQFDFNVFMGRFRSPYALGEVLPTWSEVDLGVRVGTWRSVGESQNLFALESFLDELAERAGIDPAEYRRRLLRGRIRELAVLEAALDRAGWGRKDGRSRGLAMGFANRSVVAQVVELSAAKDEVRLHRVTCVIDCGLAVNPDAVRAQMEGGVVWALSAAAAGEITLEHGAVQQSNFHDYPLAQLAQTPDIDTLVLQTQDQPGGAGEEAVAPFAPALVNALYRATGSRLRSLPLSRHGLRLGPARP